MKKVLLVLIVFISTNLFSFNWESKDFSVRRSSTRDLARVTDLSGRVFYVKGDSHVNKARANEIEKLVLQFYSMKYIAVDRIIFNVKGSAIRVLVVPKSFIYNSVDFLPYVPAGLVFDYNSEVLNYNFRIKSGEIFMKLTGVYIDEEMLCKKIEEALKDPGSYVARRDSEYLLNKLDDLEIKVLQLEEQNRRLLKNFDDYRKVTNSYIKNLQTEDQRIRAAVMAFQNDRFFPGDKEIKPEIVEAVLMLRKKYSSLSIDDFMDKLEEAEIEASEKEVTIILIVFYNEFEKEE
ncbi:MAG: hypothetical protein PF637_12205 [Spirochaetes bacterium]|jgi:hypothetical protein|nr:hypothetical protein [Spirochaetota bacterium]